MAFRGSPWQTVPLSEICEPKESVDPRRNPTREVKYVDISCISGEKTKIQNWHRMLGADTPSRARKRIRMDDVIVATTRPYLRSIARVPEELDGEICSTGFCVLRSAGKVIPDWLFYSVLSPEFIGQLTERMRGANYPQVSDRDVLESVIPLPRLTEQRRIVRRIGECMERVDELRLLSAQMALETSALLPSLLSSTFTDLGATYSSGTIGSCLVSSRYGTSRRCDASPNATPVLRIPNVARGRISYNDLKYCELAGAELERFRLETGDILVVRTNGSRELVGRCAVYIGGDRPFAFASYLIRLRVDPDEIDPQYLAFFLMSTMGRDAIARIRRTSAGQYNVNTKNLQQIELPLPPLTVQKKVTERLIEQRDVVKTIACNQIANSEDSDLLGNAVLRKAFVGEL